MLGWEELENESRGCPYSEVNSDCNQVESEISVGPYLLINFTDSEGYPEPAQLFVVSAENHGLAQSVGRQVQTISVDIFANQGGLYIEQLG